MMRSIRSRTLALVLGLLAVSMSMLSLKGYLDAQHEIEELFDAQLAQTARLIQGLVGRELAAYEREKLQQALDEAVAGPWDPRVGHRYETKLAFQVLDADGTVVLQSASAPPALLPALLGVVHRDAAQEQGQMPAMLKAFSVAPDGLSGYHDVLVDDHGWRVFALQDRSVSRWVLVAERDDVRGELVRSITLRSLLPDAVGLPVIALLLWLAIGWGLAPLQRMVTMIRARDPEKLTPVMLAPLPNELEPVVAALNRLLAQVDMVLEREKRFLADAAHELRTPLAVLRIHAQNAVDAAEPADRADALEHLTTGVERATRVVTQLLTLARLEPGAAGLARRQVDLAAFVRSELAELAPLALQRDQEIVFEADADAPHRSNCDSASIGILLQNLVGNAVQHAPQGGRVRVRLEHCPEGVRLRVDDNGPGVAEPLRSRLAERFFRAGDKAGAGLGLSIVQRIVELHRGRMVLGESDLGGLKVVVTLPDGA